MIPGRENKKNGEKKAIKLITLQTVLIGFVIVFAFFLFTLCTFFFLQMKKTTIVNNVSIEELFKQTNIECGYSCTQMCNGAELENCFSKCYERCNQESETKFNKGVFSHYLKPNAIQHVGLTVVNLTRATNFFVEMLGGVLVQGAGGDGWYGTTTEELLFQKEILEMKALNLTLKDKKIADLYDNGCDRLAATYVNFGSLQVELLDYRARTEELKRCSNLPFKHSSSSPSIKNNMHLTLLESKMMLI